MKKVLTIMAAMMAISISATAMPYEIAREEALFLSDKMAYELDLTESQYEAVYEINLDYLLSVNSHSDVLGSPWIIRNRDLSYVLSDWQYDSFRDSGWFYRPVVWGARGWSFTIYNRYSRGRLFMHRPNVFISFRGGHNHRDASFYAHHHFRGNPPRHIITGPGARTAVPPRFDNRPSHVPAGVSNRQFGIHQHDKVNQVGINVRGRDIPNGQFGGRRK